MKNLTIIIVTFLTSKKLLDKCLSSIDRKIKIIIVENSKKFKDKNFFLKKFPNLKIFCTGKNLGYGGGNNFGLKKTHTEYVLILNPDVILDKNFFLNLKEILKNKNFSLIGCQYSYDKVYMPAGFFKQKIDQEFRKNFFKLKNKDLIKVDWITGCAILCNIKKFEKKKLFDENFFLYFEEYDLCQQLKKNDKKVFLSKKLKIDHYGFKSSSSNKSDFINEANKLRNWHWMWSYYYYHKKNFGLSNAILKSLSKFFKSFFKTIFYSIIFDQINRDKYLYRFLGLFFSILGLDSSYRGKYFK
jgi:N-acetylglucosaminyl-diphospho-decaprenol L-rhamnosyltransferase